MSFAPLCGDGPGEANPRPARYSSDASRDQKAADRLNTTVEPAIELPFLVEEKFG